MGSRQLRQLRPPPRVIDRGQVATPRQFFDGSSTICGHLRKKKKRSTRIFHLFFLLVCSHALDSNSVFLQSALQGEVRCVAEDATEFASDFFLLISPGSALRLKVGFFVLRYHGPHCVGGELHFASICRFRVPLSSNVFHYGAPTSSALFSSAC